MSASAVTGAKPTCGSKRARKPRSFSRECKKWCRVPGAACRVQQRTRHPAPGTRHRSETTMAMKTYKPPSPAIRYLNHPSLDKRTRSKPENSLTRGKPKTGGRNSAGRITSRFIGGGHKQNYRVIDFRRDKHGIPGKVASIEYDPNRSAYIALINYADGEKRYIIAPEGLEVGNTITAGPEADIIVGNALPLQ